MSTGGSNKIQTGFFKRLFNAINAKRYEMKKDNKEKYLVNWDKIKWRIRSGRFLFLTAFYFGGLYFFYNKNLDLNSMKKERDINRTEFKNFLANNWSNFEEKDYFDQLKTACRSLKQFFTSDLQLGEKIDLQIKENIENDFLFKLTENLVQIIKEDPEIRKNENFKYLDLIDSQGEFLLKNLLQKTIFGSFKKKYDKENIPKDVEKAIMVSEMFYKKLICTMIPKNYLILSPNLIYEYSNIEQAAFTVALNLVDFFGTVNMSKPIEFYFEDFFNKIIDKNFSFYKGKYKDDFKLLLEDLKRTKDLKTFVVVNPFLYLNFTQEIENLKEILLEKQTENNIRKISLALELMSRAGYDVSKLWSFTFDKINYQILDIVRITFKVFI